MIPIIRLPRRGPIEFTAVHPDRICTFSRKRHTWVDARTEQPCLRDHGASPVRAA